jgi:predicted nucleotide-binding protein (sugar kinase/HSP70/actin superfamily)
MKKKELEIATTTYTVAYKKGYSQCQEDMADKKYSINDFLNMIKEYKDKELPNCNKPYHYEAEIASGLESLINYIKNKQD